ncbi:MAG: type IV conjugative transfer system protein TraL [Rickettsiaceae bacterium]|nr:type IV conjugative transfer system protein TraL [Rickettsiaceae bacterium]
MTNDNKFYIPKHIDEPARIIFFSVDEFVLVVIVAGLFFMFGHELVAIVLSVATYFGYKHLKQKESSAYVQRMLYWHAGFGASHHIPKAAMRKYKG